MRNIFMMGGRIGDTVMALYVVKKLGGGVVQMCLRHEQPFDLDQLNAVMTLVKYQPYVDDAIHVKVPQQYIKVGYTPDEYVNSGVDPIPWTHSFIDSESRIKNRDDVMREYPEMHAAGLNWIHHIHQAHHHCKHFGVEWTPDTKWIDAPLTKAGVDVVFHAPSYRLVRNRESWLKIIRAISQHCSVVIITGKNDRFDWSQVDDVAATIAPGDFVQVADYINSAKCFLGAASSSYCVAEALRKMRFVELRADCYNTYCYGDTGMIINNLDDDAVVAKVLAYVK